MVRKHNPVALISVRAYARLKGVDQKNMRTTLAKVGWKGQVDVAKVDALIAAAKGAKHQPAETAETAKDGKITFAEAERRERLAKAIQQEMKVRKIRGTLVEKSAVEKKLFELQRGNRDRMYAIPARISGILAAESSQDVVFRMLTEEIQRALQDLAS